MVLDSSMHPAPRSVRERAVLVDGNGRALRVLTPEEHALERSNRRAVMSEPEYTHYLARMMDAIRSDTAVTRRIMIVAHGGLNQLGTSLGTADTIADSIRNEGYYPILLIWDSSLRSTYVEHLFFVRQGRRREGIPNPLQAAAHLTADLGRGISRAPLTWYEQADDLARTTVWAKPRWREETHLILSAQQSFVKPDSAGSAADSLRDPPVHLAMGPYLPSRREKTGRSLLTILTAPTKLIASPLIDAFGGSAWGNMHRRTSTMFHDPREFSTNVPTGDRYLPPSGAVSRLAAALDTLIRQDSVAYVARNPQDTVYDRHAHWEITLVGHSMGAIVMNELVRHHYDLPYRNIVYMAAACSIRDWEASVLPYLEEHVNTRFYSLMLHPTVEARERNFGDVSPRGTLLEWIDDYLEDPKTHIDRMMGKWSNMAEAVHLIPPGVRERTYFRVFGYRDRPDGVWPTPQQPMKHGEFMGTDVPFYRKDFWWPASLPTAPSQE
jgi:pimeloyl-ACP methyl ester carboxylesterase